jgi:16S rRNA (guanine527-N7)-methyltransferase
MKIILKYFSDFTSQQREKFEALGPLYREWNEKINVISRKDIDGLYEKHILHSLSIAAVFNFSAGTQVLDLGTGGGFPGIPLAIFFPEVRFFLADSIGKKLKVVDAIAEAAGINNITTLHTRVEDIREHKFNFVVSRAVAPLKDLWSWSKPLLRRESPGKLTAEADSPAMPHANGLICLKGGDLGEEVRLSGLRPYVIDIHTLFSEEYFKEKYILYVPR